MFRLSSMIVICTVLAACAAPPKPQVQKPQAAVEETPLMNEDERLDMALIIKDYESAAKSEIQERPYAAQQTHAKLIQLADEYKQQNNCFSANTIIKHMLQLPLNINDTAKANIIRSECLVIQTLEQRQSVLLNEIVLQDRLSKWLSNTVNSSLSINWLQRLTLVRAYQFSLQGLYTQAIQTLINQDVAGSVLSLQTEAWLFAWLGQIPASERFILVEQFPSLNEYQTLLSIVEDDSINDAQRQAQLRDNLALIQQRNPAFLAPPQVSQYVSIDLNQDQNIAVLLPLSGRLEGQGQAIKQGILAGYYAELFSEQNSSFGMAMATFENQQGKVNITFIDTGSENQLPETINEQSLSQYSTIIGPLLKPHISIVQAMSSSQTLLINLNLIDELASGEQLLGEGLRALELNNYFALSPEQEAQQIVLKMLKENILHPVLIHDSSALSSRMAEAFLAAWERYQQYDDVMQPSTVRYADNKSMRVGITSALDVLQSQQRINQMSNLVNERVYSVTRNRRDVDAFVVFARPNELELINPIIESSMSLFTDEQIPVFATSFSYNHKQNRNSLRDLRNLVFVDMPFVLPEGRNSDIAQQVDTLFNQPSSTFLRLFAFGYDAIQLSQKALKLRVFKYFDTQGLSGKLNITESGTVTRELGTLAIQTGE